MKKSEFSEIMGFEDSVVVGVGDNCKLDDVLFKEINSHRTPDEAKRHSANKIFRTKKGLHVYIYCNCGQYHYLFEENGQTRAQWFISLCSQTNDDLIGGELTYLQMRNKKLAEME